MAARKRPAAVLDAGHATATQGPASCGKRSRTSIGSMDEYEKHSCLGKGTFGAVYRMRHRVTGKTVAIKFPSPPDDPKEAPDVDEILREARFLETCSSGNPYVVSFEGLVRNPTNGDICLAMEYVAAPSLETFLWDRRRCPPLPESTVRAFMWKLLSGTKMMHHRRVVHRDIKPANILVGQGGELVKICDLGLAISMSELPPYNQAGTASYIAPEMLLGKPDYDGRVDTWSLGCVMAEMLTGKMIFPVGDNDEDEAKINDEIVQLWSIFRLLGMPDGRTWPGFRSLPFTAEVLQMLPVEHKCNRLRDVFPEEKRSCPRKDSRCCKGFSPAIPTSDSRRPRRSNCHGSLLLAPPPLQRSTPPSRRRERRRPASSSSHGRYQRRLRSRFQWRSGTHNECKTVESNCSSALDDPSM